jgi:hypothetical protein
VRSAVTELLGRHGSSLHTCVEELATRYGDDPDAARGRMRWSRSLIAGACSELY